MLLSTFDRIVQAFQTLPFPATIGSDAIRAAISRFATYCDGDIGCARHVTGVEIQSKSRALVQA
jgi:hypothetical protein